MPLHLLGKKSWNVYNADNIARVRRDEAAAKAEEEAEEQRMQEVDAQRRLAILRGEVPPSLPEPEKQEEDLKSARREESRYSGSSRRQRKRHGEDDTDFELRLAREKQSEAASAVERRQTNAAPIVDHAGHIDLFGDEKQRMHAEKNDEVEQKKRKKEREYEDQYTMRFSNAAGRNAPEKPWYSTSSTEVATVSAAPPSKDVWGNDDPRRKDRQAQRAVASDPLATMRSGAKQLRELKQERKRIREEREQELKQLKRDERHRERHRRRDRSPSRSRSRSRERSRRHHSRSRDRGERRERRDGDRRSDRERRRGADERRRSHHRSRSQSPKTVMRKDAVTEFDPQHGQMP